MRPPCGQGLGAQASIRSDAVADVAGDAELSPEESLRAVDAVTVRVPDLAFCVEILGHQLRRRNHEIGQAGLEIPDSSTEIVLTTEHRYEPNWLVDSVPDAVSAIVGAGGAVLVEPFEIPVGRVAVVSDPFDNPLVRRPLQGPVRGRVEWVRHRRRVNTLSV